MLVMTVCLGLSLTSCDVDDYVAYSLEGTWEGSTEMAAVYGGNTYESTYSYINFDRDPCQYSSGSGYWVDFYQSDAPWEYIANHISWTVSNGVICIHFYEDNYDIWIGSYRLTDGRFEGRFYTSDGEPWDFSLVHTSSPNWNDYTYGCYYNCAPAVGGTQPSASRPQRTVARHGK